VAPANSTRASFDAPFDLLQVIIDTRTPLLFEAVFELYPLFLELIRIHGIFLLCEIVRALFISISPCHLRKFPVTSLRVPVMTR
jgi:hypothetical protein